jgi:porphobilinogen deaminase
MEQRMADLPQSSSIARASARRSAEISSAPHDIRMTRLSPPELARLLPGP